MSSDEQEEVDYLVVGAGAMGLSFLDSLLLADPSARVALVDKNDKPGGHWLFAYDYVRLHQPTLTYGVEGKKMEPDWGELAAAGIPPPCHRATGKEVVDHFEGRVQDWVKSGNVIFYPNCSYDFAAKAEDKQPEDKTQVIKSAKGRWIRLLVKEKVVNSVRHAPGVPSRVALAVPVDSNVRVVTPNEVFADAQKAGATVKALGPGGIVPESPPLEGYSDQKFTLLGAGKTACDAIIFLQRDVGVPAENISWVISQDIWIMDTNPRNIACTCLDAENDKDKMYDLLAERGQLTQIFPEFRPSVFRYTLLQKDEIKYLRNVQQVVRRGRVTAIKSADQEIRVSFTDGGDPWVLPAANHTFVHCTSSAVVAATHGPTFVSPNLINNDILFAPSVTASGSVLGKLEGLRRTGKLNKVAARELYGALQKCQTGLPPLDDLPAEMQMEAVLRALVLPFHTLLFNTNGGKSNMARPIINEALLFCLSPTPQEGKEWMAKGRTTQTDRSDVVSRVEQLIACAGKYGLEDQVDYLKVVVQILEPIREVSK